MTRVRRAASSLAALAMVACGDPLLDSSWEGGAFVTVSGPVDPDVPVGIGDLHAAIAWVWVADGRMGTRITEVPFEPRVYQYSLSVDHPPSVGPPDIGAPAPLDGLTNVGLLLGTGLMYEADGGEPVLLEATPEDLLSALLTPGFPEGVVTPVDGDAQVVAAWSTHRFGALATDSEATRLVEVPSWPVDSTLCAADEVSLGLTLYRHNGEACGGWRPVAPAGERTEFQGVPLSPLTP